MKTKLYILSLLLLSLAACTDDELCLSGNTPSQTLPEGYYFILSTSDSPTTRVVYADQNTSRFEEGDQVGIFAINDTDAGQPTLVTGTEGNARYQVQEVTNTNGSTSQVLVPAEGTTQVPEGCRYIFYYPYRESMTLKEITALTHTVESNQNEWTDGETHSVTPYEYSDLLWDVESEQTTSTGQAYVEVAMDHAMANIILEIDESYLKKGSTVDLLNVLTTAEGIDLSTTSLEALNYSAIGDKSNITMWSFGYATSGNQAFRAAIPAQSLTKGTKLFRITNAEGRNSVYSLSEDIKMEPGKNYIFRVIKGSLQPELNDDDSWVLDVLDPETGEPVGLLCREYLRYQPDHSGTTEADDITGTTARNGELNINSQAWVFYNLKPGTTIPDLDKGTVMRFIYDIHMNTNAGSKTDADPCWPLPHHANGAWYTHQGLFTPEHGFKWIYNDPNTPDYGISSNEMEDQSLLKEDEKENHLYMHGGTITWDGNNNKINSFSKNEDLQIDYATAKNNGHIAINDKNQISINYSPVNGNIDYEGNKVGIIVPHYLVDSRTTTNGQQEITKYPLVKIGYNQFWISKPFRAKVLTDGTPITCYNQPGTNGSKPADVTFSSTDLLDRGYIYPFSQIDDKIYDPYNDPTEMAGYTDENGKLKYEPAPLYNKPAVDNEKFIPTSENSDHYYVMPSLGDIEKMTNYFGFFFAAKMETRELAQKQNSQFVYDKYTAITRGETYESGGDFFTANISGFNLRAIGYYLYKSGDAGYTSIGESACLILNSKEYTGVNYLNFHVYNAWETAFKVSPSTDNDNDGACLLHENMLTFSPYYPSQFFAQVRILMKYRNQADTGGSSSISTSSATRSLGENVQSESRNIYIPIQPAD